MRQPDSSPSCLVARACAGDTHALGRLLHSMRDELTRMIAGLVGPRLSGRVEPDDVFQEASIQALRSISSLRARDLDGLRSWFKGIVRNRVFHIVYAARSRVRPRRSTPLPDALLSFHDPVTLPDGASPTGVPDSRDFTREEARDLVARYRMATVLRDVFSSQWSTVAFLMLRRTVTAARHTHLRARSQLVSGISNDQIPTYP